MRHLRVLFPILLLSLVIGLAGCNFTLAADITPPPGWQPTPVPPTPEVERLYPLTPPDLQAGEAIYQSKCADCHGPEGKGDGRLAGQLPKPPTSFVDSDTTANASPADWFLIVTQGRMESLMPAFASLSEASRWDVVAYITTLRATEAQREQGAALYEQYCAACHSDGGEDAPLTWKRTAGLTDAQITAMLSQSDSQHPPVEGLQEGDLPAILAHLRTLGTSQAAAAQPTPTAEPATATPATTATSETPQATAESTASAQTTAEPTEVQATPSETASLTPTAQQEVVTITGTVTNGSGGEVPAGLKVTLYGLDSNTNQIVLQEETETDAQGTFTFQNVEAPFHRVFAVTVEYKGATYISDWAVASGKAEINLPVTVYETTTDPSNLRANRLHIFLEFPGDGTMRVIELFIISNDGDKTVVPASPEQPVLRFSLPEGATNLQFESGALGDRFVATPEGFGDTQPVPPGQGSHQVLFAYTLPYNKKATVRHPVHLPVDSAALILPASGSLKVHSDLFTSKGTQTIEGKVFQVFESTPLQPDDELTFEISGRPTSGDTQAASTKGLAIGLAVFGLGLIVTGVVLWRRQRTLSPDEEDQSPEEEDETAGMTDPETVMDAILALDDLYQQGRLSEEAYQARRAALKARLAELLEAAKEEDEHNQDEENA